MAVLGLGVVMLAITGWSILAIYYADLSDRPPRLVLAAVYGAAALAAAVLIRPRRYGVLAVCAMFAGVLGWFFSLQPSNERDWKTPVAKVPSVEIQGDRMTVHNVRNFDYHSETDFTPAWEDRTYDLSKLRGVDFMLVYWGSRAIAHAIVSFAFEGDQYLAVSIETRKERGENYSALLGFFRQYELIYIFADEQDLVRLRTNYRGEDVYLYHTNFTPAQRGWSC